MSSLFKFLSSSSGPTIVPVTFPPAYPYTITTNDHAIIVDSSQARTLFLPLNPVSGLTFSVKDGSGMAGANAITIDGNGKTIDGGATYFIQNNYGFVGFRYNGTEWNVINN